MTLHINHMVTLQESRLRGQGFKQNCADHVTLATISSFLRILSCARERAIAPIKERLYSLCSLICNGNRGTPFDWCINITTRRPVVDRRFSSYSFP